MKLMEILEALSFGGKENDARSLLMIEAGSEKWRQIRKSEFFKDILAEIKAAADTFLKSPVKALRFSDYKKFDETGSREEFQKEYFERRARLCTFAVMFLAYGEDIYKEALEDIIWAICDEYTWCLPAHLKGKSLEVTDEAYQKYQSEGSVIPFYRSHDREVDLFNAETAFALAEVLHLTKGSLAALVEYRAKRLIRERVLEPFCEINNVFDWETAAHNWAAVCSGSVGAAAMYLVEDDKTLAGIILRVLDTMNCFLNGYQEDGVCTEGLAYWTYGFGFFTYFSELLRQRTGGKIDLMENKKVESIAIFQQNCYLTENMTVSFSDAPLYSNFRLGLTCCLKSRFTKVEVPEIKYRAGFHDDHCYRWPHIIRDFLWGYEQAEAKSKGKSSCFMEQSQWLVSRASISGKAVSLAAKGGHNDEPHNHNDIGSFIFHINGETLLTDIGAGEYTKQYFGPGRYYLLCNSSRGHSVPVINGGYQKEGREFCAEEIECEITEEKDTLMMDMAKAYDDSNLLSLKRSFEFNKFKKEVVLIKDDYSFKNIPDALVERFVSFIEPELINEGQVLLRGEKEAVTIFYDPGLCCFKTGSEEYSRHDAYLGKVYFMDFVLVTEALKEKISVSFNVVLTEQMN